MKQSDLLLLTLVVVTFYLAMKWRARRTAKIKRVCLTCGATGPSKLRGSGVITLVLLLVLPLTAGLSIFAAIAYAAWRRTGPRRCSVCGSSSATVPTNARRMSS